jgi:lysophospholipase
MRAGAVPEDEFARLYRTRVLPLFARSETGMLKGASGVPIYYRGLKPAAGADGKIAGTVVIAPGYSESLGKYSEVAFDLLQSGFAVVLYDHRGQGRSGRLLPDSRRAHIDDFENLVHDLHALNAQVIRPRFPGPYFLLAHSLGGVVGARALEEFPDDFTAAVLSSPMLMVKVNPWLRAPLQWALAGLSRLGWDQFYVRGPVDPRGFTFAGNSVSHSQVRYETLQIGLSRLEPEAQVWGVTARWLIEAWRGTEVTRREAARARAPILLLQAGDDRYVVNAAQDEFCRAAPSCRLLRFPEGKHELLMEADVVRTPALNAALAFWARPKF